MLPHGKYKAGIWIDLVGILSSDSLPARYTLATSAPGRAQKSGRRSSQAVERLACWRSSGWEIPPVRAPTALARISGHAVRRPPPSPPTPSRRQCQWGRMTIPPPQPRRDDGGEGSPQRPVAGCAAQILSRSEKTEIFLMPSPPWHAYCVVVPLVVFHAVGFCWPKGQTLERSFSCRITNMRKVWPSRPV